MSYQMIFQRYELKYLLTPTKKISILETMEPYMKPDQYEKSCIRNIYFDTDTSRLIRHSMERPVYKEKLRMRSYGNALPEDPIFVELKKKYQSVVYKRRILLPQKTAMDCLCSSRPLPVHSQIAEEINYFCSYYQNLSPAVFLSYDRAAFCSRDGSDFRITFDENILFRQKDFSFEHGIYGTPVLEKGLTLMELKTSGGIPLWMTHWLSKNRIFKTSFSKYGTAYQKLWTDTFQGGILHA